jgi:hypothetical protein
MTDLRRQMLLALGYTIQSGPVYGLIYVSRVENGQEVIRPIYEVSDETEDIAAALSLCKEIAVSHKYPLPLVIEWSQDGKTAFATFGTYRETAEAHSDSDDANPLAAALCRLWLAWKKQERPE